MHVCACVRACMRACVHWNCTGSLLHCAHSTASCCSFEKSIRCCVVLCEHSRASVRGCVRACTGIALVLCCTVLTLQPHAAALRRVFVVVLCFVNTQVHVCVRVCVRACTGTALVLCCTALTLQPHAAPLRSVFVVVLCFVNTQVCACMGVCVRACMHWNCTGSLLHCAHSTAS